MKKKPRFYLFFITFRFIFNTPKSFNRKIIFISFFTIFLSCFLSFLVLGFINYMQFRLESAFVFKDFHANYDISNHTEKKWGQIQNDFSKKYALQNEYLYSSLNGLLIHNLQKLPLDIMAIDNHYLETMPIQFAQGLLDTTIPSIAVSDEISSSLKLAIGDIVTIVLTDPLLPLEKQDITPFQFKVSAVLAPSDQQFFLALIPLSFIQSIKPELSLKKGLMFQNTNNVKNASSALGYQLTTPVKNYLSSNLNLLYSIKWEKILFLLILTLIVMISFVIIYLGFKVVLDKSKKMLVTLRILGISYSQMSTVFFYQAFILGLLGSLSAFLLVVFFYKTLLPSLLNSLYWYKNQASPYYYYDFFIHHNIFTLTDLLIVLSLEWFAIYFSIFYPYRKIKNIPLYEVLKND